MSLTAFNFFLYFTAIWREVIKRNKHSKNDWQEEERCV